MKLLVDMNLSPRWVAALRERGFEAQHWSEVGSPSAPDEEILAWCRRNSCVLLTHDLDFGAILADSNERAPSVLQLRTANVTPQAMADQIAKGLRNLDKALTEGALVTIEPERRRVRVLPLRSVSETAADEHGD